MPETELRLPAERACAQPINFSLQPNSLLGEMERYTVGRVPALHTVDPGSVPGTHTVSEPAKNYS